MCIPSAAIIKFMRIWEHSAYMDLSREIYISTGPRNFLSYTPLISDEYVLLYILFMFHPWNLKQLCDNNQYDELGFLGSLIQPFDPPACACLVRTAMLF